MQNATVTPIHSSDFQELHRLFKSLQKPYGRGEILRFNRAYKPVYPHLSRQERHRAEELVDALIAGLEHRDLASKIYGVV